MTDENLDDNEGIHYNPQTGVYTTEFEYGTDPPSVTIIQAIAKIKGVKATELPSLREDTDIDPEVLDDLFKPTIGGESQREGHVKLPYLGWTVTIFSFGRIELRPPDEET